MPRPGSVVSLSLPLAWDSSSMESVKPSGSFQREHENSRNQSESLSEHRKHKRHFSVTDAKRSEKSATSRGTKLPEVADEALALVDAPEAELDGDLEADR